MTTVNWQGYEWITQERWGQIHPEKPHWWYDPSCVNVDDNGMLHLTTKCNPTYFRDLDKISPIGVGLVSCTEKFGYGVFSIDAKLPKGKHLRDLLKNSKAIFSGNGGSSTPPSGDEKSDSTTGETSSSTSSIDEPKPSGGGSLTDFFRSMYQNLKSAGLGQTQLKEIHEDVDRITDIMKKIL